MSNKACGVLILAFGLVADGHLFAQAKPLPDVLILIDGEKLIGKFAGADGAKVNFISDMFGNVAVEWSKVQELHSSNRFAAIPKNVKFLNVDDASKVTQGVVEASGQNLQIKVSETAASQTVPANSLSNLIPEEQFQKALRRQSFLAGWIGSASAGVTLTQSTQDIRGVNTSFDLVRISPSELWLPARHKTQVSFNSVYSSITQTTTDTSVTPARQNTLKITADLLSAVLEHDVFFRERFFVFGASAFDRNSGQGLDLMQAYGGGIGTRFRGEKSQFDIRTGLGYMRQEFEDPSLSRNLVTYRLAETYTRKFGRGITLIEDAGIRQPLNITKATFVNALVGLTIPVTGRFGFKTTVLDTFLNDPPPGFKKNTFTLTVGATYAIR